jgi:hypothetical protein
MFDTLSGKLYNIFYNNDFLLIGLLYDFSCWTGQIKPLDEEEKNKNILKEMYHKIMGHDPVAHVTAAELKQTTPRAPSMDSAEFRKSTTK